MLRAGVLHHDEHDDHDHDQYEAADAQRVAGEPVDAGLLVGEAATALAPCIPGAAPLCRSTVLYKPGELSG